MPVGHHFLLIGTGVEWSPACPGNGMVADSCAGMSIRGFACDGPFALPLSAAIGCFGLAGCGAMLAGCGGISEAGSATDLDEFFLCSSGTMSLLQPASEVANTATSSAVPGSEELFMVAFLMAMRPRG